MKSYGITIQMKPVWQYFHMVLFVFSAFYKTKFSSVFKVDIGHLCERKSWCLFFSSEQIFQVDLKHVSALLTYDHLWAMSDDKTVTTPQRIVKTSKVEPSLIHSNWVVEQLPFPFDVIGLLPKSRQVEMVFSSLIETLPQGR